MKNVMGKKVSENHPIVKKKINRSLKSSVVEGSAAAVSDGLGMTYFSPFALAMNATSSQIGILHAILSLMPSISQLFSAQLIEKFRRKTIVLWGVLLGLLMFIPIILTSYFYFIGVPHMVWALIFFVGLYFTFLGPAHTAWFSWMGSLVPENRRGRYFSYRTRVMYGFGMVTLLASAFFLDWFKLLGTDKGNLLGYTLVGFGILFLGAIIAKFISWRLLSSQYEPCLKVRKKDYFSFWDVLKKDRHTPFGKFILFRGFFSFVVGVSAPFWVVYMIRDLGFSYVWLMAITVSGLFFQIIFLPLHGKLADRYGNIALIRLSLIFTAIVPFVWIFSTFISGSLAKFVYLLLVNGVFMGLGWAGYNLAASNYIYDVMGKRKVSFGNTYMNLMVGLGAFFGALVGSVIAYIGVPFMNTIIFIILLSGIGRIISLILSIHYLDEVRNVKPFSSHAVIKEIHPIGGLVHGVQILEKTVKKVEHYI